MSLLISLLNSSGGGGGAVDSVTGNIVNNTDPSNPVVTQEQADWSQSDNTAPDYIKNKPAELLTWNTVTSTTQAISINNGYIARSATSVDFTLPATASIGSIFQILYLSPDPGQLLQNSGQTIIAGDQQTAVGTAGKIDGINRGESLIIRCTDTDTEFMVVSPVGNFNVVES